MLYAKQDTMDEKHANESGRTAPEQHMIPTGEEKNMAAPAENRAANGAQQSEASAPLEHREGQTTQMNIGEDRRGAGDSLTGRRPSPSRSLKPGDQGQRRTAGQHTGTSGAKRGDAPVQTEDPVKAGKGTKSDGTGGTRGPRHAKAEENKKGRRGEKVQKNVNWGSEVAKSGRIAGKVVMRILSYVLNAFLTLALIGMIVGVIVGGVFLLYIKNYIDPSIDVDVLSSNQGLTTKLYYTEETEDGTENIVEMEDQRLHGQENRLWVSYSDIPDHVIDAFVCVEDHRFWQHKGVDWLRTIKVTFGFLTGSSTQGASTITQQLIKNLTGEDEVRVERKIQEILRALELEKQKTKPEILEMYLNTVYLSEGCYGLQAASYKYFNKDVSELTLVEGAALASIIQAPTAYDPIINPENNQKRRNEAVLKRMYEEGKLTEAEYENACATELKLDVQSVTVSNATNSWFTDQVIEDVISDLMETYGMSREVASLQVFSGGLEIYTTMDPFVQGTLEEIYKNDDDTTVFIKSTNVVQPESAMVVMDPTTGDVLGLVGGRGEKTESRIFNLATQAKRSPGSSIKPLTVYAPALDAGLITYASVFDDSPFRFNEYTTSSGTIAYSAWPKNNPRYYGGLTNINSAVERSVNTVAVRVLDLLGCQESYDFAKNKLGLSSLTDNYERADGTVLSDVDYAPLALGALTVGVSVEEMTSAYTMLANDGIYSAPRTYTKVLDRNGKVLLQKDVENSIVISEQTASLMTKMLQNVVKNGTAKNLSLQYSVDVAGKTGTADSNQDRWFIGYTPYYVAATWFGYRIPQDIGSYYGGSPANVLWDKVMTKLHQPIIEEAESGGEPLKKFETAPGIVEATYCKDSGKLLTDACKADPRGSRAETGYFTSSTVPLEYCDVHVMVDYDTSTGAVACSGCPEGSVAQIGLIRVTDRDFPVEVAVADAQYVYRPWTPADGVTRSATLPFFWSLVPEGRFVGTSGSGTRAVNSFCYEHYTEPTVAENASLPDTEARSADKQSDEAKSDGKSKGDDASGDPPDDARNDVGQDHAEDTAFDQ